MSYAIEAIELSKSYKSDGKKIIALDKLNLTVKEGSIYGFIGPNGAGKTTTIKMFMGMVMPTSGDIKILGNEAGSVAAKNGIGYLSEIAYYYNFMEAETLLKYYGLLRGIPGKELKIRIPENLKLVGLEERGRQKLKGYSKGMLQRFGIALALLGNPKLLILDEPTSGLDPIGRKEVKDIVRVLKSKGITIFLSSHHLSEVETICDEIGVIHKGKMLTSKTLAEFLDYDKDIYTIRFSDNEGKVAGLLNDKGIKFKKEEDQIMRTTNNRKDFSSIFELITDNGGIVVEAMPGHGSLEEKFFELVTKGGIQ